MVSLVADGWVIHTERGPTQPGHIVTVDAKTAEQYIADGKAKRVRWWQS